jgi:hypothetical protein
LRQISLTKLQAYVLKEPGGGRFSG